MGKILSEIEKNLQVDVDNITRDLLKYFYIFRKDIFNSIWNMELELPIRCGLSNDNYRLCLCKDFLFEYKDKLVCQTDCMVGRWLYFQNCVNDRIQFTKDIKYERTEKFNYFLENLMSLIRNEKRVLYIQFNELSLDNSIEFIEKMKDITLRFIVKTIPAIVRWKAIFMDYIHTNEYNLNIYSRQELIYLHEIEWLFVFCDTSLLENDDKIEYLIRTRYINNRKTVIVNFDADLDVYRKFKEYCKDTIQIYKNDIIKV